MNRQIEHLLEYGCTHNESSNADCELLDDFLGSSRIEYIYEGRGKQDQARNLSGRTQKELHTVLDDIDSILLTTVAEQARFEVLCWKS